MKTESLTWAVVLGAVVAVPAARAQEVQTRAARDELHLDLQVDYQQIAKMERLSIQQKVMEHYHEEPTLEYATEILNFGTDPENMTYRMGFASQLLRRYSAELPRLLAGIKNSEKSTSYMLAAGEWLADTPECSEDLDKRLKEDEDIKRILRITENSLRPDFTKLELLDGGVEETHILDMAWGAYDATRQPEILQSFIRCAARSGPPEEPVRLWSHTLERQRTKVPAELGDLVSMAAKWSLISRARENEEFSGLVQEYLKTLPAEQQENFRKPLPQRNGDMRYSPNPN